MLKGPFTWDKQRDEDGHDDFRIADGYDNRISSCYDQANAHWLTHALNEWWFWRQAAALRKFEMLSDNTKE